MTDAPSPAAPARAQVRSLTPTTMAERTIMLIVVAVILDAGAVIAFLGFKSWSGGLADVAKYLAWIGLGALLILGVALLVQLSSKVGSKVQTSIGPTGLSVDIEGPAPDKVGQ